MNSTNLLSPKQVARAIGVSESSLKRWCDQGLIETVRTVGGHRKMHVGEVLRFAREHDQQLVAPESLGLPPVSLGAVLPLARSTSQLVEALLAGNEALARQIVFNLHFARHSLSLILDQVVTAAFHEIGDRWACHEADAYQERRGCEIARGILGELKRLQETPAIAWPACGGTIEGDSYGLPSAMVELVLRECGFNATALGTSLPFTSLCKAVRESRPKLFWLSISHICDGCDFVAEFAALSQECAAAGTALVVGGRALTADLRQRMKYSAFCDTMQHLEGFAKTLQRVPKRGAGRPSRGKVPTAGTRIARKDSPVRRRKKS